MDIALSVVEFVAANAERILALGKSLYGKADEHLKLKLKSNYEGYLENSRLKYSKSKSFFVRDKSVDLYEYYVPTGLRCIAYEISKPMFYSCINASKRMVITGTGGAGKSILMKHLFLDCIRDKNYVPVLIELRDLNLKGETLDDYILTSLDGLGFKMGREYVERAMLEGHFSFFFDGFDELEYELRRDVIKFIRFFSVKYRECPIFLSSRPDDFFNGIDEFSVFKVLPLDLESASDLVLKLPYDSDVKIRFTHEMRRGLFSRHRSFLSNPLLLSIMLLTYGDNAEVPSKLSIFYNQAFETLFQRHDANKGGYRRSRQADLDIQQFSRVFSLFCVLTLDRRNIKMSRINCLKFITTARDKLGECFKPEDFLSDLLSAVCLMIEDGLDMTFTHRSFQEYFVAVYIADAAPGIQKILIEKYWQRSGADSVIMLLLEMKPDLVERLLILPKLKELFDSLGVLDKVELPHVLKYVKSSYEHIRIARKEFTYTVKDVAGGAGSTTCKLPCDVVEFAMVAIAKYENENVGYYEQLGTDLFQKHSKFANFISIDISAMSVTDSIMVDILNSKTMLSFSYLNKAYSLLKVLEVKYDNLESDFEALLSQM